MQGVADILFLKGVDLGIVRADTLDYLEKKGFANDIKKQFTYVTKLYNEEMQVVAPKEIFMKPLQSIMRLSKTTNPPKKSKWPFYVPLTLILGF